MIERLFTVDGTTPGSRALVGARLNFLSLVDYCGNVPLRFNAYWLLLRITCTGE